MLHLILLSYEREGLLTMGPPSLVYISVIFKITCTSQLPVMEKALKARKSTVKNLPNTRKWTARLCTAMTKENETKGSVEDPPDTPN